ncbi:hypothetical protein L596_026848 [Steinernema carpocapsae]|uniref:G-protein coupled receptors family 1 profile domain-containing protein n=1 Tax=Steinernema carpocapsae TaxID=34508 RepID=A0A4U5M3I2_STECR|nr:hypothetical protein L596_026848 [Steinernema carpocapsae]
MDSRLDHFLIIHYLVTGISLLAYTIAISIICFKTPKSQRDISYTLLDILIWELMADVVWGLFPVFPNHSNGCFYLLGFVSPRYPGIFSGGVSFLLVNGFLVNAAIGVVLSFCYRWVVIVASKKLKNLGFNGAALFSVSVRLLASFSYFLLSKDAFKPYSGPFLPTYPVFSLHVHSPKRDDNNLNAALSVRQQRTTAEKICSTTLVDWNVFQP